MEESIWHKHKWPPQVKKSIDYPDEPLFSLLDNTAEKSGDFIYTIFQGATRTYGEVRESADRIANFLTNQGIKKGDRVAIFLPNVPMYPSIFFGILKTGATTVTCNPLYTAGELNYQLKDTNTKVVFCLDHPRFTPICYEAIKGTEVKTVVVCSVKKYLPKVKAFFGGLLGKIPKSPHYEEDRTVFYDDIMVDYEPEAPKVDINPKEDLALILYTGGTTGTPKGAMLTHLNLYGNVLQNYEYVRLDAEDGPPQQGEYGKEIYMGALPWYHSYGLTLSMLGAVNIAAKLICIPDPRAGNPPLSVVLEAIHKHKATVFHAVPTLYAGICYHANVAKYDLTSLKACGSGAAPLPPELAKRFEEVTGAIIFEGYGLTETAPLTHANPTNTRDRKFGTVGLPVPDTYVKIVDLETGVKEMPIGEDGEIALSGPQVMKGYWNKPKETEAVFREIDGKRFFLTGDIGHLDEEGFTVITDRKKDMINVSGLKAYPREIEDKLFEHPKIAMAAAIGVPREDDPTNEFVKAFIVLKPGETTTAEEIKVWAKDRMAGYKRPKEIEFRDALPQTVVGKVLRRELKTEELEKRGL
ncbi:MAG: long-chain-fatty-acid--CoA ligase [Candidatus Hodarchaeales archaeon]|jgi:long-chain acyl-CoA synthetase